MDYKNNSNTGLIIVADCMLLSVEYIGNVHLFFNNSYVWKIDVVMYVCMYGHTYVYSSGLAC